MFCRLITIIYKYTVFKKKQAEKTDLFLLDIYIEIHLQFVEGNEVYLTKISLDNIVVHRSRGSLDVRGQAPWCLNNNNQYTVV